MPKKADRKPLKDSAIQRQVQLERIKAGQVRDFNKVWFTIEEIVRGKVARLTVDLPEVKKRAFNRWLAGLEKSVRKALVDQTKLFTKDLEKIAGVYAAIEATDISKSITGTVKLKSPTARQAFNLAKTQAMAHSGETLQEFVSTLAGNETRRVVGVFRRGYYQGKTNYQLVRELIGTKARNYQDGILRTSRHNAKAVVQTSVQHVASVGRMRTWEENKDIVEKYEWVSTLDSRTTQQCKSLDGQQWEVGEGPIPPIHVNCRSTTVAVLNPKYDFLAEGRTRSAEFGPVKSDKDYYEWLKTQGKPFQEQALGKTRAKLFRDGGLSAEEFRKLNLDRNFEPLTLKEMQQIEPAAFESAGIDPGGG